MSGSSVYETELWVDLNWMLSFRSHELLQFRSWPLSSPASLILAGQFCYGWATNFPLTSLLSHLFYSVSFPRAYHLQVQFANSPPSLLALLQYPWTKFTYKPSSSHHLYSEIDIDRSGISLQGEGRGGHSRPRHRLKMHAGDGWLRKGQVVQPGCIFPTLLCL